MNQHPHFNSRRGNRTRCSFGRWLTLVVGGGFAGTFAALQLVPGERAAALVEPSLAMPIAAPENAAFARAPVHRTTPAAATRDGLHAHFGFCHRGGGAHCVVDGDTFWFGGAKIRIADIDAPETHPSRCAKEQALGDAATRRLQDWLNAGAFSLEPIDRDIDRYGRKLRVVTRGGRSVGDMLVGQGLARWWGGRRRPWC